jgi:hypothetical protein
MAQASVSQHLIEALVPYAAPDPTTPTGAGVSQYVIEALVAFPPRVRVSQHIIEVLVTESETQTDPGGVTPTPTTHTFGYAV